MKKLAVLFFFFSTLFLLPLESFANEEDYSRIYLATFCRSGNHWVRYLIEEASHIATSSVYKVHLFGVPPHLKDPFPWGGYCAEYGYEGNCRYPEPGEPVVIKTHYPQLSPVQFDLQPSTLTIRLVRHPIDSFHSFYLFSQQIKDKEVKIPKKQLISYIKKWRKFQEYWNQQENVLTIRYEDLLENPELFFREIMEAIGYEVSEQDIQRALDKYPPQGEVLKHSCHYSSNQLKLIYKELGDLMSHYGYEIPEIKNK